MKTVAACSPSSGLSRAFARQTRHPLLPLLYQTRIIRRVHDDQPYKISYFPTDPNKAARELHSRNMHRRDTQGTETELQEEHQPDNEDALGTTPSRQREDFVPFIGSAHMSSLASGPTLTANEKKVFVRLSRLANFDSIDEEPYVARRVIRHRQADSDLDSLLDASLRESNPEDMSDPILVRTIQPPSKTPIRTISVSEEGEKQRNREFSWIEKRLEAAKTDYEVWQILETEILGPVTALRLDDPEPEDSKDRLEDSPGKVKQHILKHNLALLLHRASTVLRIKFPTSLFILAIIPQLRRAGPSPFALGASTQLYNEVLSHLAEQQDDMAAVSQLLSDMETDFIEPSRQTRRLLARFLESQRDIRAGALGRAAGTVWATARMKKLRQDIVDTSNRVRETLPGKKIPAPNTERDEMESIAE